MVQQVIEALELPSLVQKWGDPALIVFGFAIGFAIPWGWVGGIAGVVVGAVVRHFIDHSDAALK